jgi:membrane-associated phospholipid phosphatase
MKAKTKSVPCSVFSVQCSEPCLASLITIHDLRHHNNDLSASMKKLTAIVLPLLACLLIASPLRAEKTTETAADVLQVLLPASAYAMTFLQGDPQGRPQFYKSFLSTVAATYMLNVAIDAEAPNGEEHSFPSGHTAMAFSGASFLQKRYGWRYGAPAYLAAAFVGWSRVDSEDHEVLDAVAGAALGTGFTYLFTDRFETGAFQVAPIVGSRVVGINVKRMF